MPDSALSVDSVVAATTQINSRACWPQAHMQYCLMALPAQILWQLAVGATADQAEEDVAPNAGAY